MRNILIIVVVVIGLIAGICLFAGHWMQRAFFYPKPHALPAVVTDTTDALLNRLQLVLEKKAPLMGRTLQPGLSAAQIAELEVLGGFQLSEDLKALYRWHNGMPRSSTGGLLPGNRFIPLEEVVQENAHLAQQLQSVSFMQRLAFSVFASHRKGWVQVLNDGSGDGYFYDPARADAAGAFFFSFAETRSYVWFPSLRNFLSGVIDAYESGAIRPAADGIEFDEDYEKTQKIWMRLGESNEAQL